VVVLMVIICYYLNLVSSWPKSIGLFGHENPLQILMDKVLIETHKGIVFAVFDYTVLQDNGISILACIIWNILD
jgi:hypothetical protein